MHKSKTSEKVLKFAVAKIVLKLTKIHSKNKQKIIIYRYKKWKR